MYSWMIKWTELTTMVHFRRSMAVMYALHRLMRPRQRVQLSRKSCERQLNSLMITCVFNHHPLCITRVNMWIYLTQIIIFYSCCEECVWKPLFICEIYYKQSVEQSHLHGKIRKLPKHLHTRIIQLEYHCKQFGRPVTPCVAHDKFDL